MPVLQQPSGIKRMTGLPVPEEGLFQATTQTATHVLSTLGLALGSLWIENLSSFVSPGEAFLSIVKYHGVVSMESFSPAHRGSVGRIKCTTGGVFVLPAWLHAMKSQRRPAVPYGIS